MGGQARAAAETYSGRIAQMKNAFGELKESIGNLFIGKGAEGAVGITAFLNDLAGGINKLKEKLLQFQIWWAEFNITIAEKLPKFLGGGKELIENNRKVVEALRKQLQDLSTETTTSANATATKKRELSEEETKQRQKDLETLAKMDADYQDKLLGQKGDTLGQISLAESQAYEDLKALTTVKETEKETLKNNIAAFYAEQRKQMEYQKAIESAQAILSVTQRLS